MLLEQIIVSCKYKFSTPTMHFKFTNFNKYCELFGAGPRRAMTLFGALGLSISLLILCAQSYAMNYWLCRDIETGTFAFCISS